MKKLHVMVMALLAGSVVGAQAEESAVKAVPLELFACSWQEGKGMADLESIYKRFNKWSDKHDSSYSAWTITPQFRTSDQPFDLGWIGVWPNGAAMGAGLQAFQDEGGDIAKAFDAVADCSDSHGLFSSVPVNMPAGGANKTPLVQFSSCTLAEGSTAGDVYAAHKGASDFMTSHGGQAASWILWPALGAGDIDFDYYSVVAYDSYEQLGKAFEAYANGGGWQKIQSLMSGVAECDNPRLYDGKLVRDGTGS